MRIADPAVMSGITTAIGFVSFLFARTVRSYRKLGSRVDPPTARNAARLALAILLGGAAACGGWPELLRRHTYPPDFRYVSRDHLRTSMWILGRETLDLRSVLADPALSEETRRTRAELLLGGMATTVRSIGRTAWSTNHPELREGLRALEADIHAAHEAVKHEPPSYFLAGSVSGACLYCHGG